MSAAAPPGASGPVDLLVHGGRVVLPDGVRRGDVVVHDGRVLAIGAPGATPPRARRTVDATGCHVLPGLIDSHVHFRTPGLTEKEDWVHGSRAAAAGGVTTVFDMPNTRPPLFTPEDLDDKRRQITGTSLVDFGLHVGVDPERLHLLREFGGTGISSTKAFLVGHHTAPHVLRGPGALPALFDALAGTGLLAMFHAECSSVFELLDAWQGPPRTWTDYEARRPRTGAIAASAAIVDLVRERGQPAHVLHVSTREEADLLTAARSAGLPVSFEVTAHHLSFTDDETAALGARIRLSPAIRTDADRRRLWAAVVDGDAATLGSDHAPHRLADKFLPPEEAPPGLPGVQELLPALLTGLRVRAGEPDADAAMALVARRLGTAPAELFRIADRKGRIAPGADADLAIVEPDVRWSPTDAWVQSKCGWSAYQGRTFTGRVRTTVRRGEVIFEHGDDASSFGSPDGRFLPAVPAGTPDPARPREAAAP